MTVDLAALAARQTMPTSYAKEAKPTTLVVVSCDCDLCKTNAAKVGASFPLKAEVPPALVAKGKRSTANHGVVYDAHNPDIIGQVMRRQTGIRPVA